MSGPRSRRWWKDLRLDADKFDGAACAKSGLDPEIWTGDKTSVPDHHVLREYNRWAIEICHGCPVQHTCLMEAIDNPELKGVWGGSTEDQRKPLQDRYQKRRNG